MPWRTCRLMDERLRFVARLLEGETTCRNSRTSRWTIRSRAISVHSYAFPCAIVSFVTG